MTQQLDRLRSLLDPDRAPAIVVDSNGYLDLLGNVDSHPAHDSLAQRTMEHPLLAAIYERLWRPAGAIAFMGFDLKHFRGEKDVAINTLRLSGSQRVLDVACGPGNFTSAYAAALEADGIAVGLDVSAPMLSRAVNENGADRAAYLRASAADLPFLDSSFDAVACYAALYLMPEPFMVIEEMIRVLRPGGRIALMTSRASRHRAIRGPQARLLGLTGLRMFEAGDFTGLLQNADFIDIEQEIHGVAQYVSGTKSGGADGRI